VESTSKKAEVAKLFFEVSKILKRNMRKSFEELGITISQSLVIGTLIDCGEMKTTDLSREINLSNSTVSGIIDRLEKQQLVVRRRSEEDRRVVYVRVAPKFEGIHQGIHGKVKESFTDLLSTGTPEEIEKVIEGLNVLKKILNDKNE
jgi:DNA-binding MarR family transcriptional regulator